ncbi:MAG TPA: TRAP transporter large permease [Clostridiaceae bacterium]|nr:TRAP transporter large permease [Clostridiaceae bacterium]
MVTVLFISFIILLLLGVPIAFTLGIGSAISMAYSGEVPLMIIAQKVYSGLNNFNYMAIPLFLIAGNIMAEAQISNKLVALADLFVGRMRGGLASVSTGASAFFGAISGSAPATTAAIGSIMIPSMSEHGYKRDYSAAVVAASGCLGLIIPPSLTMVVYGVTAGVSIGRLFASGFVPGILIAIALMILNYFIAKRDNIPVRKTKYSKSEIIKIVKDSIIALMMPLIILGGIYSGIFTATESAAVACLYGVIVGLFVYRTLSLKQIFNIFMKSIENIAMILMLMATASIFGYIIAREEVPQRIAASVLGVTSNQYVIMFIVLVLLLIIGCFMDNVGALVLITPTLVEIARAANIDLIYFGVFMIIALAVGQITPPVGLNLFVATNVSKSKFEDVVRYVVPYIGVYVLLLIVFIFVPQLLMTF